MSSEEEEIDDIQEFYEEDIIINTNEVNYINRNTNYSKTLSSTC